MTTRPDWEPASVFGMTHWRMPHAYLRAHPLLADAVLAVVLYSGATVLWGTGDPQARPPSWPVALAWTALSMATVVIRRKATWLAIGALAAHTVVSLLVPRELQVDPLALVLLTYTAAVRLPLREIALAATLLWAPPLVLGLTLLDTRMRPLRMEPAYFVVLLMMTVLLCLATGRTMHHRRAYIAALEGRTREAERNQQALAAQAVADERRRIARELHDMVAHHVSVMGVLATGSRRTLHRDPAAADEALATIEETGRTALRELRRLLDVLRTEQEPAGELAPQPGLAAPGRPGRAGTRGGPAGPPQDRRRGRDARPGCRADRLPDRAGGADQRDQTRRYGDRRGTPRHRHVLVESGDQRHRPGSPAGRRPDRPRPARHAGTGHALRRYAAHRPPPGRRLPGVRENPGGRVRDGSGS